ncbi:hypothetical protein, partial [Pseudomonas syringae]
MSGGVCFSPKGVFLANRRSKRERSTFQARTKKARFERNAVHLSGAALRLTGYRVFDIFTALGLAGLG